MKIRDLLAFGLVALIVVLAVSGFSFYVGYFRGFGDGYLDGYGQGCVLTWDAVEAVVELDNPDLLPDVTSLQVLMEAWVRLKGTYVDKLPSDREFAWAAIHGMVSSLKDPYTKFLSPEELRQSFIEGLREEEDNPMLTQGRLLSGRVGYVQLPKFELKTRGEFEETLELLLSQGAEVLILDLRGNPGGLMGPLKYVAAELFPEGTHLASTVCRGKGVTDVVTPQGRLASEISLVVVVDGKTASASEILAGAIQDHERGILVGETTFGKGRGSTQGKLCDGSLLQVRTCYWRTPLGRNIDGVGLTPDIIVPMPEEPDGIDPQLEKALECALALLEEKECR